MKPITTTLPVSKIISLYVKQPLSPEEIMEIHSFGDAEEEMKHAAIGYASCHPEDKLLYARILENNRNRLSLKSVEK